MDDDPTVACLLQHSGLGAQTCDIFALDRGPRFGFGPDDGHIAVTALCLFEHAARSRLGKLHVPQHVVTRILVARPFNIARLVNR